MDRGAVIVTGGTSGIGAATVLRLGAAGYRVGIVGRNVERGERVAAELRDASNTAVFEAIDMSDVDAVESGYRRIVDRIGPLTGLVNNHGIGTYASMVETSVELWDRTLDVNLRGVWASCRAASPYLARPGSSVVNISSFHAHATIGKLGAYAASKAGLVGMTRSIALEWAPDVRVNVICPGLIDTPMWQADIDREPDAEAFLARTRAIVPLGRVGLPEEVSDAVEFLLSEKSSYITGTALYVDGGMTARLIHP